MKRIIFLFIFIPCLLFSAQKEFYGITVVGTETQIYHICNVLTCLMVVTDSGGYDYFNTIKNYGLLKIVCYFTNDQTCGYNYKGERTIYVNFFFCQKYNELVRNIVHESTHVLLRNDKNDESYREILASGFGADAQDDYISVFGRN
jgi:hypothetical protein